MPNPSLREIYSRAMERRSPEERAAYLDQACAGDHALKIKVEALLKESVDDSFLETPAAELPEPRVPAPSEEPGVVIGRYKLLQKIGEGGFGVVYMAEQLEPVVRRVALKIIKPGMDTRQVIARFEAERQALAMMDHAHVARVLDAGATESGRPYFVMELVRGIPITRFCDENELRIEERLELFLGVCSAIQHAHQKGVIHRDIKPSNVMITLHDDKPVPKVIDFGIAKAIQQRLTERTLFTHYAQFVGTPAYVSPEQAQMSGLDIDTRSDIYSLGVLLYELVTGRTPLDGRELIESGIDEVRRRIREDEPVKPSTRLSALAGAEQSVVAKHRGTDPASLRGGCRGELDWIVMKALEKDRTRRYDTAKGFANDVRRYLNHEPVEAAAPSVGYRARKFIVRHRKSVAAASLTALVLVCGTVVSTWQAIRATQASERERLAHENVLKSLAAATAAEQLANRERRRAESLMTQLDLDRAEDYFSAMQHDRGLASLARALRREPSNRGIAGRLIAALSGVSHMLPAGPAMAHPAGVRSASFNRDGSLILTVADDGKVYLWDGETPTPEGRLIAHDSTVQFGTFSPDGELAATASQSGAVQLWRVPSCEPSGDAIPFGVRLSKLLWSADGRLIAGGAHDGSVQCWDLGHGGWAFPVLQQDAAVLDMEFNPQATVLAVGCEDGTARIWNLEPRPAVAMDLRHTRKVTQVRFSPDGGRLLTASHDGRLRLWDSGSWTNVFDVPAHSTAITCVEFDPSGSRIASGSWDKTVRILDAATGTASAQALEHDEAPSSLCFLGGGEFLATGSRDARVRLWSVSGGRLVGVPFRHQFLVYSVAVSPDGERLLTASNDDTARLLDARAGNAWPLQIDLREPVVAAALLPGSDRVLLASSARVVEWGPVQGQHETLASGFPDRIGVLAVDGRGNRIAVGGVDGRVRILQRHGRAFSRDLNHESPVNSIEFSPDGSRLLTAGETARVWLVNPSNEVALVTVHQRVSSAHFSPDGASLVTASWDCSATVWDAQTGEALTPPLKHGLPVLEAAFDPTGQWIATASRDQTAGLWEADTGRLLILLPHRHEVGRVLFSPDGRVLATASGDHQVSLWRVPDGVPATSRPLHHADRIQAMSFSSDGQWLATASAGIARVWDIRSGRTLTGPLAHANMVSALAFAEEGRRLITASWDGTALRHDLPSFKEHPPNWLPLLAESVGGLRFTDQGQEEVVAVDEFLRMKSRMLAPRPDGEFESWARWFLSDRGHRNTSFRSPVTVPEFIRRRLREESPSSLRTVLALDPANAEALSKLSDATRRR